VSKFIRAVIAKVKQARLRAPEVKDKRRGGAHKIKQSQLAVVLKK
jgi:hypothetical protein